MPDAPRVVSTGTGVVLATIAVGCMHLAFEVPELGIVVMGYLVCMMRLAWLPSSRHAFYFGVVIGLATFGPQLAFFARIFRFGAPALWTILALWTAVFLVVVHVVVRRWPRYGGIAIPFVWMAVEYGRSELYYLRFSWLAPGFALHASPWSSLLSIGVYGVSFFMLLLAAIWACPLRRCERIVCTALVLILWTTPLLMDRGEQRDGPFVVGIQLEFPWPDEVLTALQRAAARYPAAELFVLSEYTFDGSVPAAIREWCREGGHHLIAGGKSYVDSSRSDFYNTAFVVDNDGKIIFEQAKAVPIQFFNDGIAAPSQSVWASPWGRIGIATCYDLSYARVIDRLIQLDAEALIVPTMDVTEWGQREHELHAKVAPMRAREYGIPIFRLASSGESQLVDSAGRQLASAPFPGQGEMIAGVLPMATGSRPLDRYFALLAIAVAALVVIVDRYWTLRDRWHGCGQ